MAGKEKMIKNITHPDASGKEAKPNGLRRLKNPFIAIARAYEIAEKNIPRENDLKRQEREAQQWVRDFTS